MQHGHDHGRNLSAEHDVDCSLQHIHVDGRNNLYGHAATVDYYYDDDDANVGRNV